MFGGLLKSINSIGNGNDTAFKTQLSTVINSVNPNSGFTSIGPRFQDGGYQVRKMSESSNGITKADMDDLKKAIKNMKIITTIEDIKKADTNYTKLQDRANF